MRSPARIVGHRLDRLVARRCERSGSSAARRRHAPAPSDATARIVASAQALLTTLDEAGRAQGPVPVRGTAEDEMVQPSEPAIFQREGLRLGRSDPGRSAPPS